MSNELSIAACTASLRLMLESEFEVEGDHWTEVTTFPLDRASSLGNTTRRLNLFLYHIAPNAAWRNQNFPDRGERYQPPLAVNLYYLITAFGDEEAEEDDHKILGRAMTIFHENATLLPDRIRSLIGAGGPRANPDRPRDIKDSDIHEQVERIRISPEPLSVDDMMKLWGTFHQSPYRISAAYQASVILMERKNRSVSPFPVFGRGTPEDTGPRLSTNLPPILQGLEYRDPLTQEPHLPAARLGDVFAVAGANLPTRDARLLLFDPKKTQVGASLAEIAEDAAELEILPGSTDFRIVARLTSNQELFAGRMRLVLQTGIQSGRPIWSNPLQILIAPSIVNDDNPESSASLIVTLHENRRVLIAILQPRAGQDRGVSLLLTPVNDARPPEPIPGVVYDDSNGVGSGGTEDEEETPAKMLARQLSSPDEVIFDVTSVPPNRYRVRIRVDMVESLPLRRSGEEFLLDSRQEVAL